METGAGVNFYRQAEIATQYEYLPCWFAARQDWGTWGRPFALDPAVNAISALVVPQLVLDHPLWLESV